MRRTGYIIIIVPVLMVLCFLAGRHSTDGTPKEGANSRRVLYWVDPMHPTYKSDKPGIAPDCGMQLEPVYADGTGEPGVGNPAASMGRGTVNISLEQQQSIGVRVAPLEETSGTFKVRVLGRVVADEARVYRVNAATEGYIKSVLNHSTGSLVRKDELLASFGAQEILTAQQSFVGSASRSPENRNEVLNSEWRTQYRLLYSSRLRAMGMSEIQIAELGTTQKISDSVQIYSPTKGFILARNVSPGQRFEKGAEFYRIADLSHVWIVADINERELQNFRPGTVAFITLPNQKKSFHARVSNVPPQFDPATRTMKLRLEAENPGYALRPDMFVDVELPVHIPAGLTVPVESLLDSGMKKRVFVDRGNGYFEPREIETGWRFGDRIQVVSGLAAGDRIVVSGTFLVDSESRLKAPTQRAAAASEDRGQREIATAGNGAGVPSSAQDVSCGMDVKTATSIAAGNTERYRETIYYFCSSNCRDKFRKDPEHYLASGGSGRRTDSKGKMPMPKGSGP